MSIRHNLFTPCDYTINSLIIALITISSVFVAEYGFNILPCQLCLYQRVPYFLLLIIGVITIIKKRQNITFFYTIAITITWVVSFILAIYHSGVEAGYWSYACNSATNTAKNVQELALLIKNTPFIPCDKPTFTVIGLSMANMNAFISLLFTVYGVAIIIKYEGLQKS